MSDLVDINDRLNAAADKAENGAQIIHDVANGDENLEIQTESGPLPTLASVIKRLDQDLGGAVDQAITEKSSIYPLPDKIPLADSDGKIDINWLPGDLAHLSNYAELRAYTGPSNTLKIIDTFRTGRFRKISESPSGYVDDGGITIIGLNGWVWQRINIGEVDASWYLDPGWVEGVTNDTPAFQKAVSWRRANGGGTVRFYRRHLIDEYLYVNDYVHLKGALENAEELLDGKQEYSLKASTLLINPAKTIYLESGASLSEGLLIPKGLNIRFADEAAATAGVAAFAGTAVTARGAGVSFHDSTVWGFNQAFYSKNLERARVQRIKGDCNNGIYIEACYDVADVSECHFWPWLTTHRGFSNTLLKRPGTAFGFANVGDWNRVRACFSFGYERGYVVDSCDNMVLDVCQADHISSLVNTTSIAFEVKGTSRNTLIVSPQAAAQHLAVLVNTSADKGQDVQIINGQFWDNDTAHIRISKGYADIVGTYMRGGPVGIDRESGALGFNATSNRFDGVTIPVRGVMDGVSSSGNTYVNCTDSLLGLRKFQQGGTGNAIDTLYAPISARNHITRSSGGALSAPIALPTNTVIHTHTSQGHNGTDFVSIAQWRTQTRNALSNTSAGGAIIIATCPTGGTSMQERYIFDQDGSFKPLSDGNLNLGAANLRFNNSYFAVAPTVGSDARYKTTPKAIPENVLDAWEKVRPAQYQLLDAIDEKGKKEARLHIGWIAQDIVKAFNSTGADACDYGLLCHDSWDASPAVEEVLDESGNVIIPGSPAVEASDRYSIRYEEALVLECALMRRSQSRLEARLAALESK